MTLAELRDSKMTGEYLGGLWQKTPSGLSTEI
jgi:hypothetical protein